MTLLPLLAVAVLAQADAGAPPPLSAPPVEAIAPSEPLPLDAGVSTAPGESVPVAATTEAAKEEPTFVRVTLKDGQILSGRRVQTTSAGGMTLALGNGALIELSAESIDAIAVDSRSYLTESGETFFTDPNRTRYLFGPSAMPLKKNELYFSQLELLASTVSWGVTDWATVQVGASVPLWFASLPDSFHLLLGGKVAVPVTDRVHLAAGALMLWIPLLTTGAPGAFPMIGLGFGAVTYGTRDQHVTFAAGVPINLAAGPAIMVEYFKAPILSVSGNYRLTRGFSLVTENWLFLPLTQITEWHLINSLALRVMGDKLATDIGFVLVSGRNGLDIPIPIPWLNFTYNFF